MPSGSLPAPSAASRTARSPDAYSDGVGLNGSQPSNVVPPQPPHVFDGAQHRADPALARKTKCSQLRMGAGELGAGTDSHDQPAPGDPVEGRQTVRQRQGMPKERQQDGSAEPDASRRPGNGGEEGEGFAARTRQQRVAYPHGVVAGLLVPPRRLDKQPQVAVRPQQDLAR